jgi:hypothetical protein
MTDAHPRKTTGKAGLNGPPTIQKNSREEIRFSVDRFHGHELVNCRVWFADGVTGEMRPGKQGLAFNVDLLPEVLGALEGIARQLAAEGGAS